MKSYPVSGKRSSVVLRPQSVGKRRGGVWQPRGELSRAILIFGIERPRQVDHCHLGSRRTTIRRSKSYRNTSNKTGSNSFILRVHKFLMMDSHLHRSCKATLVHPAGRSQGEGN